MAPLEAAGQIQLLHGDCAPESTHLTHLQTSRRVQVAEYADQHLRGQHAAWQTRSWPQLLRVIAAMYMEEQTPNVNIDGMARGMG